MHGVRGSLEGCEGAVGGLAEVVEGGELGEREVRAVVVTRVAVFGKRMPGKRPLRSPTAARTAVALRRPCPRARLLQLLHRGLRWTYGPL